MAEIPLKSGSKIPGIKISSKFNQLNEKGWKNANPISKTERNIKFLKCPQILKNIP